MSRPRPRHSRPGARSAEPAEPPEAELPSDPLAYRLDDVSVALGVSRGAIEREIAAGRFPDPDFYHLEVPLWMRNTLVRWIARGGARS